MASVDVTGILQACQSPDAGQRQHGEAKLKELESDPLTFFISLSQHLATTSNPVDTRKLSGMWHYRCLAPVAALVTVV